MTWLCHINSPHLNNLYQILNILTYAYIYALCFKYIFQFIIRLWYHEVTIAHLFIFSNNLYLVNKLVYDAILIMQNVTIVDCCNFRHTPNSGSMLVQCWTTFEDGGATKKKHWLGLVSHTKMRYIIYFILRLTKYVLIKLFCQYLINWKITLCVFIIWNKVHFCHDAVLPHLLSHSQF